MTNFTLSDIGLILGIVLIEVVADSAVKIYRGSCFLKEQKNNPFLISLAIIGYSFIVYLLYLSYGRLNFALISALWSAGSIISMSLLSQYVFKETLTNWEFIGIGIIISGVLVVGFLGENNNNEECD